MSSQPTFEGGFDNKKEKINVFFIENAQEELDILEASDIKYAELLDAIDIEVGRDGALTETLIHGVEGVTLTSQLLSSGHAVLYRELTFDDVKARAKNGLVEAYIVDPEARKIAIFSIARPGEEFFTLMQSEDA